LAAILLVGSGVVQSLISYYSDSSPSIRILFLKGYRYETNVGCVFGGVGALWSSEIGFGAG
jgi:hypothetical protein